ncbi:hypothetical protein DFH28DRAFT_932968 [Melampsora americana]|nr:hypothetical protein DFH28DRAFT_932968 [Melampsora americana]
METRRRNYRENPTRRRTKQTLIADTQASIFEYQFPKASELPPLPDSPISQKDQSCPISPLSDISYTPLFPDLYSLPPLPPSPVSNPNSIVNPSLPIPSVPSPFLDAYKPEANRTPPFDLTPVIDAYIPDVEAISPQDKTISVDYNIPTHSPTSTDTVTRRLSLLSLHTPSSNEMSDPMSSQAMLNEDRAISTIVNRIINLGQMTTYRHLAKDGSNMVQWQDDVERTIYLITGARRFWETARPTLATRLDNEKNTAAMIIIKSTINK